ncbi:putative protein YjhP [Phycisphaerales bacterium]|nr:putative protein YjhP [Phycisphaerales bacterium]
MSYTILGHATLDFMSPLGDAAVAPLLDILDLPRGGNIADFGAGKCELAIRLVERFGVHAECVELSPELATDARARAAKRLPKGGLTVHEGDAGHFKGTIPPGSFDLTICIGSSHALGGFAHALTTLTRLTRPGGLVLIGEGYWKQPPPPDYLQATGISPDEFAPLAQLADHLTAEGLAPRWLRTASEQEWDDYEWSLARNIEDFARANPDDPDAAAILSRSRQWRRNYLQHGRDTLGFAMILARRD